MVTATGTSTGGGGFLLRGPNWSWVQSGAINLRYGAVTPTSSGLSFDVPNTELTAAVPTGDGSNWSIGMWAKDQYGNYVTIATVSGTAPATVALQIKGQVPVGSRHIDVYLGYTELFHPDCNWDCRSACCVHRDAHLCGAGHADACHWPYVGYPDQSRQQRLEHHAGRNPDACHQHHGRRHSDLHQLAVLWLDQRTVGACRDHWPDRNVVCSGVPII
jgi:hypothetical protein